MNPDIETKFNSEVGNSLIKELELKYDSYSDEERGGFDSWLSNLPESSLEQPIVAETVEDVLAALPKFPNYSYQPLNLFFQTEASISNLEQILAGHISQNPNFEISVVRHSEDIISVGIGSKIRNNSTIPEGEFFGHNHPILEWETAAELPGIFLKGLLPSPGDLKGYSKFVDTIKNGTRIYSPYGYVNIQPMDSFNISNIADYASKYFNLFVGKNEFDWTTDDDVSKYFEEKFHLKLDYTFLE